MKQCSFFIFFLIGITGYAHQPDLSSAVLSTSENGIHVMQITSALTAFEGEIDFHYSKNTYKTPDEFKNLVVDHFEKNVLFIVNEKDTLEFGKPLVILGHETKLVAEVLNIPGEVKSIYFKNTMFQDMPQNQMAVMMLTEGFPKEQYVLANENNQKIQLVLQDGKWQKRETTDSASITASILTTKNLPYILLITIIIFLIVFYYGNKNRKKYSIS